MSIHPMRKSLPLQLLLRSVSAEKTLRRGACGKPRTRAGASSRSSKALSQQAHSYNRLN